MNRPEIARLYQLLASMDRDLSAPKNPSSFGKLLDALVSIEREPWLDERPRQLLATCLEMSGQLPEAAREFESAGLWADALRCFRTAGDMAGAARCAVNIPEDPGAKLVF